MVVCGRVAINWLTRSATTLHLQLEKLLVMQLNLEKVCKLLRTENLLIALY